MQNTTTPRKTPMNQLCACILLLFLTVSVPGQSLTKPRQKCLSYEPMVVRLTGTLRLKTFEGLDYASTHETEAEWVLVLRQPVCVNGNSDYDSVQKTREIQLVLHDKTYRKGRKLAGKTVVATGTLFGEITSHHHTPVLMDVTALHRFSRANCRGQCGSEKTQ